MPNQSLGPVQVTDVTVLAINDALRQLQERIDALKGLSGGTTIHAALTATSVRVVDGSTVVHGLGTTT